MKITTHPNQRTIIIQRDIPKKTKATQRPYTVIYADNLAAAGRTLNGLAFKLYCYLISNEHCFNLAFSPQDFINNFGGSIRRAQDAFKELEEAGYIVKAHGNTFKFYEIPCSQEPNEAASVEVISSDNINSFATADSQYDLL